MLQKEIFTIGYAAFKIENFIFEKISFIVNTGDLHKVKLMQ